MREKQHASSGLLRTVFRKYHSQKHPVRLAIRQDSARVDDKVRPKASSFPRPPRNRPDSEKNGLWRGEKGSFRAEALRFQHQQHQERSTSEHYCWTRTGGSQRIGFDLTERGKRRLSHAQRNTRTSEQTFSLFSLMTLAQKAQTFPRIKDLERRRA